ncbi:nucleobase:cation symporter-2 family protein [Williamsia sp. DF01-3]|uniref:nucleobase:cation symporter-2 family protein n=1 Tax=Williamsia sp. DF01-3 TaxID=2934157 RepID=UPI000DAFB944|nr:nucleobase:cation symporter-2 family protein [Williamsia sp. DF01-3]MCK0515659.1 purine permease [Williamsia sp. DF01-3]PZU00030.1 MAG: purine permease [Gordonia sp. (in: high G+C Gram-positive bacteria)]
MASLSILTKGKTADHPVDEVPPLTRLVPLGLQHVLAMYAGAVAVPLIVGGAMVGVGELDSSDIVHLIMADLFVAGIATILQAVGFWRFGVRLPLMQGVTFAAVSPMITIGTEHGITAIYGAVIASGLFMILMAPVFGRLIRFFPPLVTGTIILIIGVSLMRVAAGWFGGGTATGPDFGTPSAIGMGFFTLLVILLIERFAPDALRRVSVLLGLLIGTLVSIPFGMPTWDNVSKYDWVGIVTPFQFGAPTFQVSSIIALIIVAIVIMTETTGDTVAVGEIVGKKITPQKLADGLRADGLGTILGGVFNTFPYTAFAQNVGLVAITGVKTRHVATCAGIILVILGLLPKMAAIIEGIPMAVLGGAGVALFGMVAASGVRTLSKVSFNNRNILVVAISVGVAMLTESKLYYTDRNLGGTQPVDVALDLYDQFPDWFQTIFHSGISAGALTAIILNLMFNSAAMRKDADTEDEIGGGGFDAPRGPFIDPRDALEAADPSTSSDKLRVLANKHEDLHTIIVTNPNADADLCDWIRKQDNPKVKQVYEKWDGQTHGEFSRRGRT